MINFSTDEFYELAQKFADTGDETGALSPAHYLEEMYFEKAEKGELWQEFIQFCEEYSQL